MTFENLAQAGSAGKAAADAVDQGEACGARPLLPEHRDHLAAELGGDTAADRAEACGARSVSRSEALALGFRLRAKDGRWQSSGGILLPFWGDFAQLRCDDPPLNAKGDLCKYLNRSRVKQTLAIFGDGPPTIATEGWKDGLRLHFETGQTVCALPGVSSWKLLPDGVRLLIYDADAAVNPAVWGQLVAAGIARPDLRLAFFPRELAGAKGGACEFFSNGGEFSSLGEHFTARKLLLALPDMWDHTLRADWHAPALRGLAKRGAEVGLDPDAVQQLVVRAAKVLRFPVARARSFIARPAAEVSPSLDGTGEGFSRTEVPIDLQGAETLIWEEQGLIACKADTLYRYMNGHGYWSRWRDSDAAAALLDVLKRIYTRDEKGRPHYIFGSAQQVAGAVKLLRCSAGPGPIPAAPAPLIVFGNGTYRPATGQLEPHCAEHGATYGIDADHIALAGCPGPLQRVIATCFPEGTWPIIRAAIRWLVDPTIRYGEAFHFLGNSGTGKGTIEEFLSSLIPPELQSSLPHPCDLSDPDKTYQFVRGRRLVRFPDCPAHMPDQRHAGIFFSLVENAPLSTRRLHSSDTEMGKLYARCVLASVEPLVFGDGTKGFARRVLTVRTLPRIIDVPDASLKSALVGDTPHHRAVRSAAVSWALAMPLAELTAVLEKRDPAGLLADADLHVAASSDSVSRFIDECMEPHTLGPNAEVSTVAIEGMFDCYRKWADYCGVQHRRQRAHFIGQLRKHLGAGRCLPRRKETAPEAAAAGRDRDTRENLPLFDAGYQLRPGLMRGDAFAPSELRVGGLERIRQQDPAVRPEHAANPAGSGWNPAGSGLGSGLDQGENPVGSRGSGVYPHTGLQEEESISPSDPSGPGGPPKGVPSSPYKEKGPATPEPAAPTGNPPWPNPESNPEPAPFHPEPASAEAAESVGLWPKTNLGWVEAALEALNLAPDPQAAGPVWDWITAAGGEVGRSTVKEALARLREQDNPLLDGPGCRIPGTLESRGAALPDPWADAPVEAQPPAADPPSPAPAPRRPGAPAWLPLLLELRALAPDAAPFTLSLRLQTEHGVRVSGREAKEALALHDRQHGANGHRPYPSVRVTTRRGRLSICRSPWDCCWLRASFRPSE